MNESIEGKLSTPGASLADIFMNFFFVFLRREKIGENEYGNPLRNGVIIHLEKERRKKTIPLGSYIDGNFTIIYRTFPS